MKGTVYKAPGGIIRVSLRGGDVIESIEITGDFFFYPEESVEGLEKKLVGVGTNPPEILKVVKAFYDENDIESPGIEPQDMAQAIVRALNEADNP